PRGERDGSEAGGAARDRAELDASSRDGDEQVVAALRRDDHPAFEFAAPALRVDDTDLEDPERLLEPDDLEAVPPIRIDEVAVRRSLEPAEVRHDQPELVSAVARELRVDLPRDLDPLDARDAAGVGQRALVVLDRRRIGREELLPGGTAGLLA